MKLMLLVVVLSLLPAGTLAARTVKPVRVAVACYNTGEETSGLNKICFYDCLGSRAAITIAAHELCPLWITR
jgi:hypothetical protein